MAWYEIILAIALLIFALVIIAVVLLQEGRRSGIAGAISGGADTFLSKNKARTLSAKLQRLTKYIAIVFILLVIASTVVSVLASK